ncbi:MAG TPA: hypothetical protein DC000_05320 [Clostridiales bacterium]|nr:hypothetical protein [Clostridiales bacterium]
MKIAVIDDGVNSEFFSIGKLSFDIEILDETHIQNRENKKHIVNHGTVCSGIIRNYAPKAQIGSIKIMDYQKQCSCEKLIAALDWCYDNDIFIVHMSVGSSKMIDYVSIRSAVNKLAEKNIIVVAAFNNSGKITFPASFDSVIGVRNNEKLEGNEYFVNENSFNDAFIIASGTHVLLIDGELKKTKPCNSYSAPLITAIVHNLIDKYGIIPVNEIKKLISDDKAIAQKSFYPYFFNKAVLVNLSDENLIYNPFFHVMKAYNKFNYKNVEFDKTGALVIIPNSINDFYNEEKILYILEKNKSYVSELLYVGIATSSIENLCYNDLKIPLTDEKYKKYNYLRYIENDSFSNASGPILSIKGTYKNCIKLVYEINRMFETLGYNSKAVSSYEKSYLYDIEYISSNLLYKSNILKLFNFYNLEVMIINSNNISADNLYDIIIVVDENTDNIVYSESKIIVTKNYSDRDIKDIFNYILDILV